MTNLLVPAAADSTARRGFSAKSPDALVVGVFE